jgi:hypothetical protein
LNFAGAAGTLPERCQSYPTLGQISMPHTTLAANRHLETSALGKEIVNFGFDHLRQKGSCSPCKTLVSGSAELQLENVKRIFLR